MAASDRHRPTVVHWTPHFYPLVGGLPSHIESICSGLTSYRHLVVTDRLRGVLPRERFRENAEVLRFGPVDLMRQPPQGMGRRVALPIASLADLLRGFRQRRFIRRLRPAVLHVHDFEWNLVELAVASGPEVGGRIVRSQYAPLDGIPALMTKHSLFPAGTPERLRRWERTLTLQYPTIVCVDRGIEEEVRRWAAEAELARDIRFIPNGIDPDRFSPSPFPPFDRLHVGFVGRLDVVRGEAFLADFLSQLPDFVEFHGALAADIARFEAFRSRFPSARIHLERNVRQDRLAQFYGGIHVLINPLTVEYPVTRSALEAMGCGRCVIMFGSHPRPPLVDRETALFVPPARDIVVQRLRELHESPQTVTEVGARARRAVEVDFSNARVLPSLNRLYGDLVTRAA